MKNTPVLLAAFALATAAEEHWSRFRGPNGSGVAETAGLPVEFGPDKNVIWKAPLPPGYSSPVLTADKIFLTAHEKTKLYTLALNRKTGSVLWRAAAPAEGVLRSVNTPVSASPATDGTNVYVFFESFGLVSYDGAGKERWRLALGPFDKAPYGMAASPVYHRGAVFLQADQDRDSFLVAVDAASGKVRWRQERGEVTHGFSSPLLLEPAGQPAQVLALGSYQLQAYDAATGEKLWFVTGMAWQNKSLPVLAGDKLYVHSWMADMSGVGLPQTIDPWDEVLPRQDKDGDGKLAQAEIPYEEMRKLMFLFDLNKDRFIDRDEWNVLFLRNRAKNGVYAIRLPRSAAEARGDLTKNVLWRYEKTLPNIPSPVLYNGLVFLLKEGGILSTLDAESGKPIKQGRLTGALDPYYASPVAADGKIYAASQAGKVSVIKAAGEWEMLAQNDLGEEIWATPALAGGRIYLRTAGALYCFGKP